MTILNQDNTKSFADALKQFKGKSTEFREIPLDEVPEFYRRNLADTKLNDYINNNPLVNKTYAVDRNALYKCIRQDVFNRVVPMIQGTLKIHKMPLIVGSDENETVYIPMRLLGNIEEEYIDNRIRIEKRKRSEIPDNDPHWLVRRSTMILSLATSASPFVTKEFIDANGSNIKEQPSTRYLSEEEIGLLPKILFIRLWSLYNQLEIDYNPENISEHEIQQLVEMFTTGGNAMYDPKKLQTLNGISSLTKSLIIMRLLELRTIHEDNLHLANSLEESEQV